MSEVAHSGPAFKAIADDHTILRGQVGSGLHGITIAGTDDRDEMGICIEPPEFVIGNARFEQYQFRTQEEGVRSGPNDLDLVVYSLRKWARLASAGNPTVLLMLYIPKQEIVSEDSWGTHLRNNRDLFLSREAGRRFKGYMMAQKEQMLGLRQKHTNRPELIAEYGYDTKFAYHMIRLGVQGVELLTTNDLTLPMTKYWRDYLLDVRLGKYTKEEVLSLASELISQLDYGIDFADLPEQVDQKELNGFIVDMYQDYWKAQGLV